MSGSEPIRVVNPATGEQLSEVPDVGRAGVEAAVARARAAAPAWGALPVPERAAALRRWRKAILDEPSVAETLVLESGKPRYEAEGAEVLYLSELIRFAGRAARRVLKPEVRRPFLFATKRTRLYRKPLGVVGVIGPWNFPILNNAADAVFPLVAGNAVVLKPSEVTPLTSLLLGDLWLRAGNPEGVFQVVTGRGEAGAALVDLVDGVMFTGSVATGRKVAARCGERLVPCVTELGGKSPFVVLAGADLDRAARAAAFSSFFNSGQACIRTERVYVEEAVADEFERLFAGKVKALRQGVPDPAFAEEHDLGSVTFARQLQVAEAQLSDAVSKGAKVLTGGKRREDLPGLFLEPTVLSGATHEMELMREETFGPLVGVMRVKDAQEALLRANDSHLGLSASVFGPEGRAREIASRIDAGIVNVNDVMWHYAVVEAPVGGQKASGVGLRHGTEGIRQWTRLTAVTSDWAPARPVSRLLARWLVFPYDRRVLAVVRRATRLLYGR